MQKTRTYFWVLAAAFFFSCVTPRAATAAGYASKKQPSIVLTFQGNIDGSAQLTVSKSGATFTNSQGTVPKQVTLNGFSWNPQQQSTLENSGASVFLTEQVDFRKATIERVTGRDTVALERGKSSVTVFLCDTVNGDAPYEFRIILPRADDDQPTKPLLRFQGSIDGSDELTITARSAMWKHKHWGWPGIVSLNGVTWKPEAATKMNNDGPTAFLDPQVDFLSAKIVVKGGRDTVAIENYEDGIILYFADNPPGAGRYDVTVEFDKKGD